MSQWDIRCTFFHVCETGSWSVWRIAACSDVITTGVDSSVQRAFVYNMNSRRLTFIFLAERTEGIG